MKFTLDWGVYAVFKLLRDYEFETVLDVGSGQGEHKRFLEHFGKNVYSVDVHRSANYVGDFNDIAFDQQFDVIWCSHVLEHQRNPGLFLDKIFKVLKDDGILALTVPKHPNTRLVPGHISSWSPIILCYHLILAGFDCRNASILETFELSLIVKKVTASHDLLNKNMVSGEDVNNDGLAAIKQFFPFDVKPGVETPANFCINWPSPLSYDFGSFPGFEPNIEIVSKNIGNVPVSKGA